MVGDEIVPAKKNIQLARGEIQRFLVKYNAMDHCVKIVAPVINFWHMDLAQGIVNGQDMKAKRVAQMWLNHHQRRGVKVYPQHACLVVQGGAPVCGGQINGHMPCTTAIKGAQHCRLLA